MILTDRDIRDALAGGALSIEPAPPVDAYAPNGVDLTLDSRLTLYRDPEPGEDPVIDPARPGYSFRDAIQRDCRRYRDRGRRLRARSRPAGAGLDLRAGRHEADRRGSRRGWKARARSPASASIIHLTAPTIHAGSTGRIQLEIINLGPRPIRLRSGMKVCQLILEQTLGIPEVAYRGQFAGQRAAE